MKTLIIGANGQIGKFLVELMAKQDLEIKAMVRKAEQEADLQALGAETVIGDLEKDFSHAYEGCQAVVFAAGSGAHTGKDKTELVDHQGAIRSIDFAVEKGSKRYLMVSALRADQPKAWPDSMVHYFEAKSKADAHLRETDLDYTILRPGQLNHKSATQNIALSEKLPSSGEIPREDVAHTLLALLSQENTYRKSLDLLSGDTPIQEAVKQI